MNEDREYLKELKQELNNVLIAYQILLENERQTTDLMKLDYTPNTKAMLRVLDYRIKNIDLSKLSKIVQKGLLT